MNAVILHPIGQEAIGLCWPWVRDGLLQIIRRGKERWLPEDVYMALRTGAATLYLLQAEAEEFGFLVLQKLTGTDGTTLFVWAGWSEPGAILAHRREVLMALDDVARSVGARRIRHNSSRDGWEFGDAFKVAHKVYEREV